MTRLLPAFGSCFMHGGGFCPGGGWCPGGFVREFSSMRFVAQNAAAARASRINNSETWFWHESLLCAWRPLPNGADTIHSRRHFILECHRWPLPHSLPFCLFLRPPVSVITKTLSAILYIGWSDVTESMTTIRSPFCGCNMAKCVELRGEDLSCYLNNIRSAGLRKCLYDY